MAKAVFPAAEPDDGEFQVVIDSALYDKDAVAAAIFKFPRLLAWNGTRMVLTSMPTRGTGCRSFYNGVTDDAVNMLLAAACKFKRAMEALLKHLIGKFNGILYADNIPLKQAF